MRRALVGTLAWSALLVTMALGQPHVAGHPTMAPMAACAEEDGSTPGQAFPCAWQGADMGNGLGASYVLAEPLDCTYDPTMACR